MIEGLLRDKSTHLHAGTLKLGPWVRGHVSKTLYSRLPSLVGSVKSSVLLGNLNATEDLWLQVILSALNNSITLIFKYCVIIQKH